uniref:Uncharacterized protein n=1 Tax=Mycena chlorophos TaxID=658473 RepID=A0ABQ0L5C9_MYCCL|nr:predicted protein [Mycena chlorophos]
MIKYSSLRHLADSAQHTTSNNTTRRPSNALRRNAGTHEVRTPAPNNKHRHRPSFSGLFASRIYDIAILGHGQRSLTFRSAGGGPAGISNHAKALPASLQKGARIGNTVTELTIATLYSNAGGDFKNVIKT